VSLCKVVHWWSSEPLDEQGAQAGYQHNYKHEGRKKLKNYAPEANKHL
jgi:hypothetical protein